MDLRKLKKLIDLVQESGIAELEITEGEEKVKIVKGGAVVAMAAPVTAPALAAEPRTAPAPAAAEGEAGPERPLVKAPVVGNFYRSPPPPPKGVVLGGGGGEEGGHTYLIKAMNIKKKVQAAPP